MADKLETKQNSIALVPITITRNIVIEDQLLELDSNNLFSVSRDLSIKDKPTYDVLFKGERVASVQGFIMDGIAQIGIVSDDVYHITNWTKLVKLLITKDVLSKELQDAETKKDGLAVHRLNLQLSTLNSNIETLESLPTVALFSPIASYKIDEGLLVGSFKILSLMQAATYEGNFNKYNMEGVTIQGEQSSEIIEKIKSSPVYVDYLANYEQVYAVPASISIQFSTNLMNKLIQNRKVIDITIIDIYKADIYPPAVAIDEMDSIDSHIRNRLYQLSTAQRDKNVRTDVQKSNILSLLDTSVAKAVISRLVYPVKDSNDYFNKNDKISSYLTLLTNRSLTSNQELKSAFAEKKLDIDDSFIKDVSLDNSNINAGFDEVLDFILISVFLLDNQPITALEIGRSYIIKPYTSTLLQFITAIARYNKYKVIEDE